MIHKQAHGRRRRVFEGGRASTTEAAWDFVSSEDQAIGQSSPKSLREEQSVFDYQPQMMKASNKKRVHIAVYPSPNGSIEKGMYGQSHM